MRRRIGVLNVALGVIVLAVVAGLPAPASARPAAAVPDCLAGTWTLSDPAAYGRALNTLISQGGGGLAVTDVSGNATITVQADGTYQVRYERFSATLSPLGTFAFEGTIDGIFRETAPGYLAGSVTQTSLTATITINGFATNFPLEFTVPEGEAQPYECTPDRLTVYITVSQGASAQVSFSRVQ